MYSENSYLFNGYKEIGRLVAKRELNITEENVSAFLINEFKSHGRHELFDKLIKKFSLDGFRIIDFLEVLRTFKPYEKLNLYEKGLLILKELVQNKKTIFVVTNGNPIQQKNKIDNLNWEGLSSFIQFVLANQFEPKPSPKTYYFLKQKYDLIDDQCLMIGDLSSDQEYAVNCGIDFLNVNELYK